MRTCLQWDRVLWLDEQLREGTYPNRARMAAAWGISPRQATDDKAALEARLDVTIEYDGRRHGWYYPDTPHPLPALGMGEGELLAVLLAQEAARTTLGTPLEAVVAGLVKKLVHTLPDHVKVDADALRARFAFRGTGVDVPYSTLTDLASAARGCHPVHMLYHTQERDSQHERTVEPYRLHNVEGDWLLRAHCRWREATRVFKVSRIREYTVLTNERFTPDPASAEPEGALPFRTHEGQGPQDVELEFDTYQARWIREKRWHDSQVAEERSDGSLVLRMTVSGLEDVKRWVLGFGRHCRVLGPATLRTMVLEEADAMVGQYGAGS